MWRQAVGELVAAAAEWAGAVAGRLVGRTGWGPSGSKIFWIGFRNSMLSNAKFMLSIIENL